ncbi:MAG: right-handed parallel beta-helix repeat-containing protein [Bacteroidales bacterium]|nr:right-handed parallel beta-helix repeat-containing protein [Bacteroidales bacterium]
MRRLIQLLPLVLLLICCGKDEKILIVPDAPNAGDAGLIEDFEMWTPPTSAIHVDASQNDPEEDGSMQHPYNSFDDFEFTENMVCAVKRGTEISFKSIVIRKSDVTICSYGEGGRPVLHATGKDQHAIATDWVDEASNITIRDIEVYAPESYSCVRFGGGDNLKVINCILHDAYWSFRALQASNVYVENTEMYEANDDGMFLQNVDGIEIKNCYVHHVNTNWKPPQTPDSEAPGDGIQLDKCLNWYVHHNYIDRSNSGNKFCFIASNPDQKDCIFEFNYLKAPKKPGSGLFFGSGSNLTVRYNFIIGPGNAPLWMHSRNTLVYGNIFENLSDALFVEHDAKVFHNLFIDMPVGIYGNTVEARNNIFSRLVTNPFRVENLTESNNLVEDGEVSGNSFKGDAGFVNFYESDYHLTSNSDCIDRGVDVGIYWDRDGNRIPHGSAPDIGPYEYVK